MTYDQADKIVSDNLTLIGYYSKQLAQSQYLIKYLLIVPSTADIQLRFEILNQWLSNGFDNSEALFNLDLQNEQDFKVIMFGEHEGVITDFDFQEQQKEVV